MIKKNYLILSGGTGGHVIPAVNFGNFIIEKGFNCFLCVDKRGMKYTNSFRGQIKVISSSHLSYNFFGKILALVSLFIGFFQSLIYLIKVRPYTCVSFGSYATFAPLLALVIFRFFGYTKIFLHEQTSTMGKVNVLFSPFANKIFLNFGKTLKLKNNCLNKTFLVGLPNNQKNKLLNRKTDFNKKKYIRICIFGGSQGSLSLNKIILGLFNNFPRDILDRMQVSMQCPEIQKEEIKKSLDKLLIKYELSYFFHNFHEILYESEILIGRAGAGTINGIILTQIPAILVPLPSSSDNHQYNNANYLKQRNATLLIEQKDLNSEKSLFSIISLINNLDQQNHLIKNLQKIKSFNTNQLIFKHLNENI